MKGLSTYFKEAYIELVEKVSWPTWAELQSSATVVMVATLIIAAIIGVMDFSTSKIVGLIYGN